MLAQIIMYIISISSIVLGFVALLKQKTYLDSETKQPTEIEISKFGKLKTNYPALVFVFLGFVAAFFAFQKSQVKEKAQWIIQGSLVDTSHRIKDWSDGEFKVIPTSADARIDNSSGKYTISIDIDKGRRFEDEIKCIIYSNKYGNAQLYPGKEYNDWLHKKPSLLSNDVEFTRFYKPLLLSNF
jgi:hypothetical protein